MGSVCLRLGGRVRWVEFWEKVEECGGGLNWGCIGKEVMVMVAHG